MSSEHHQNHNHTHDHDHEHAHGHSHGPGHFHDTFGLASKNILLAFCLNFGFALFELVGASIANSFALFADALHDLGDSLTLIVAYFLEKFSEKKRSDQFTYGYRRFSLLSALITGLVLAVGSGVIIYGSIERLLSPQEVEPKGQWMMAFAVVGILVNGWGALRLSKGSTHNEKMLSWHFIEDVLGWALVLLGGAVIYFTDWSWIDPLLALFLAGFILWNVVKNIWITLKVFLQATPAGLHLDQIQKDLEQIPGIQSVHDLHVWTLDGAHHVLSLHAVIRSESFKSFEIKKQIREMAHRHGNFHVTIELEENISDCNDQC